MLIVRFFGTGVQLEAHVIQTIPLVASFQYTLVPVHFLEYDLATIYSTFLNPSKTVAQQFHDIV